MRIVKRSRPKPKPSEIVVSLDELTASIIAKTDIRLMGAR